MKKKFITKVVGVAIATLTIFTLCFTKINNVRASAINDYQDENYWAQGATPLPDMITDINDLKGKTFSIPFTVLMYIMEIGMMGGSFDIFINILARDYIGIELNEETHETIECVDYLQYPYIIYERAAMDNNQNLYNEFNIFSCYSETLDNYSFFYFNDTALNPFSSVQVKGTLLSKRNNFAFLPLNNMIERTDVPFNYNEFLYRDDIAYINNKCNYDFLTEQDFLDSPNDPIITSKFLNFYFVFPNTDRYTLSFNSSLPLYFLNNFSFLQPYNANIEDQILSRIEGYNNGYSAGLIEGSTSGIYTIFTGVISSVNEVLQIEIFPNVKLGYFIWLPLTLGIVSLILMFWRKD